jgi:hypothetical protein
MIWKLQLLKLRDLIIGNFFVNICAIKTKKTLLIVTGFYKLLLIFVKLCPFFIIKYICLLFGLQIIYKTDNIYQITNITHTHINPVIFNFTLETKLKSIDMSGILKYYNSSIPLKFFINNNQLENYDLIKIKYLHKGKISEKIINIGSNLDLPIYNLFN